MDLSSKVSVSLAIVMVSSGHETEQHPILSVREFIKL